MSAYYNEHHHEKAAWLRELIKARVIAPGEVDERSIEDVQPNDLTGFDQCHFFAGIGVWSYALRLAGWSDDRQVWTGSCPCQPFSAAGKGTAFTDERHLWPAWFHLIEERNPPVVFGEQVASPDGLVWLELVQSDMEGSGYAFGASDLCAASVGAPHIRQRLYFVAESDGDGCDQARGPGATMRMAHYEAERRRKSSSHLARLLARDRPERLAAGLVPSGHVNGFWRDAEWIYCRDSKYRPVEPGAFPLAHGAPFRVGRLRGYGDAIVADQAAAFIYAYASSV